MVDTLHSVGEATAATAAARVGAMAPNKPSAVAADKELSALWDEIVPQLDEAGLLSTADVMSVEMAIRHFSAARLAHNELMAGGIVVDARPGVETEDGQAKHVKRNPAELTLRLESGAYLEYAKQLGMTFVARARTAMPKGDEGDRNPFAPSATGS